MDFVKALISVALGFAIAFASAWSWDLGEKARNKFKRRR